MDRNIRRWLRNLEEDAKGLSDTIPLSDGTELHLSPNERLESLLAAIDGEDHPLHAPLARISEDASAEDRELRGLILAFGVGEEG